MTRDGMLESERNSVLSAQRGYIGVHDSSGTQSSRSAPIISFGAGYARMPNVTRVRRTTASIFVVLLSVMVRCSRADGAHV